MKRLWLFVIFVSLVVGSVFASPAERINFTTIEGTIKKVVLLPEDLPYGPLYNVTLTDVIFSDDTPQYYDEYTGINSSYTLYINHDKDDGALKNGMRIKVYNYQSGGDERKLWWSFDKIELLGKDGAWTQIDMPRGEK